MHFPRHEVFIEDCIPCSVNGTANDGLRVKCRWIVTFDLGSLLNQEIFSILYEYIKELVSNDPKRFFKDSNSFLELENDALFSLIQYDNFKMEEIEIWDNLLEWAIAKNPTISSNRSLWKTKEIEVIKQTIHQFIPYIRFFQISLQDYHDKIQPLSALLPERLEKDINLYFNSPESPLSSNILPPRISIDSRIIKTDHIYQISRWIDRKQRKIFHSQYEFNLLLCGSRDGFNVKPFKKKCYNKGATLVIIKLKEEDKIIGGYNPINWGNTRTFLKSNKSFIFSFYINSILDSRTILSRVKNSGNLWRGLVIV